MATDDSFKGKNYFGVEKKVKDKTGKTRALNDATTAMANRHGLAIDIFSPTVGVRVAFKAFLTAFTDSFDSQLETLYHVGHPQPTRRQKSVDRSIQIGIDIPSFSVEEAKFNLRNISLFTKMLYPAANVVKSTLDGVPDQTQILSGGDPIFKVRFMNLIVDGQTQSLSDESTSFASAKTSGLMGYIDSLSYEFDLEQNFHTDWKDHKIDGHGFDNFVYPKLIKLSFTFYPLLQTAPVWKIEEGESKSFTNASWPYAYKGIKAKDGTDIIGNSFAGKSIGNKGINKSDEALMNRALGNK